MGNCLQVRVFLKCVWFDFGLVVVHSSKSRKHGFHSNSFVLHRFQSKFCVFLDLFSLRAPVLLWLFNGVPEFDSLTALASPAYF